MVASGLPVKNGKVHGKEIADMAISILDSVNRFSIRHMPSENLKLRIGIHSGKNSTRILTKEMIMIDITSQYRVYLKKLYILYRN